MDWKFGLPALKNIEAIHPCYHRDYISEGYRHEYTLNEAILSLFTLHNETMNIWSHLIAFVAVLTSGFMIMVEFQGESVPLIERILIGLYIVCAAVCMFLSTVYVFNNFHHFLISSSDITGSDVCHLIISFLYWLLI
jgi:predicted membrane channel-forming protein YqfA (hemolysin III family)